MSNVVEKVKDKVEQVLHKDKHHSSTTAHTDGHHHTGTTGITGTTGTTGTSTNAGPHDSNLANKLDPRVDSDRDGSSNLGAAQFGPGSHNAGTHQTHNAGLTGTTGGYSTSTNAGPHDSNLANKLDPRVDSDRDGSSNMGAAGGFTGTTGGTTGHHHANAGVGSGLTNATGYGSSSTNAGPHDSNLANKLDPRVDSDRDGSSNLGAAAYGPGSHQNSSGFGNTAVGSGSTNYGPHDSNLANKVDPRVDSDRDGSSNAGMAAYGPGSHNTGTQQTHNGGLTGTTGYGSSNAGPHGSNLANKLDPRVDSDRDGSRTVGSGGAVGGNY